MHKCQSAATVVSKIWSQFPVLGAMDPTGLAEKADAVVKQWNSLVDNSPGRIGPRALVPYKDLVGEVVLGGERVFIGALPTLEPARIRFTKRSGKAEGTLDICGYTKDGSHAEIASFKLGDGMDDGKVLETRIPAGVIPVMHVNSKSMLKHIKYAVKLVM